MSAASYNIIMDQGADFAIQLTISENGSAKDLTSYSSRSQMRLKKTDTSAAASFVCTVTDSANGVLKMEMGNTVTAGLLAGIYFYDLELYTASDAYVIRILGGQVTVTQEITR